MPNKVCDVCKAYVRVRCIYAGKCDVYTQVNNSSYATFKTF
jgi:hypothetical protein